MIRIIKERCAGCGQCVKVCPVNCISIKDKCAVIEAEKCTYCSACVSVCKKLGGKNADKFNAIEITEEEKAADVSAYKNVWIFAEILHNKVNPVSYELMTVGRKLADALGEKLCVVIIGDNVKNLAGEFFARGADTVYLTDSPVLKNFRDDAYAKVLTALVKKYKPNKLILPATSMGRPLSAMTAIWANTGLTADVTKLEINASTRLLHATRPTFGGNLMAEIVCKTRRPEMCSLRPMCYERAQATRPTTGEIIEFPINAADFGSKTEFLSFEKDVSEEEDISSADIIVAGGRGLGKADGFDLLAELAHTLGGAVGASRFAVDSGWAPYRKQIGLTGRTVKPKLYIACGISGQIQHLAGMSSSDTIVAINKDAQAPIMKQADYAIVGDIYEIVPELIKQLKPQ